MRNWQLELSLTYFCGVVEPYWYVVSLASSCSVHVDTCAMVKSRYIGDGHLTINRNPYIWYIKPYYWVDDHPLLYGNNGSLDPSSHEWRPWLWTRANLHPPLPPCQTPRKLMSSVASNDPVWKRSTMLWAHPGNKQNCRKMVLVIFRIPLTNTTITNCGRVNNDIPQHTW